MNNELPEYKQLASKVGKLFLKHGATSYREYVASDLRREDLLPFPSFVKLKIGETIVYAAVEFKSETQRNKAMKAIVPNPEMYAMMQKDKKPPFDYRRMVYGGYKIFVDL